MESAVLNEVLKKIEEINKFQDNISIMEICGTHTMAISKYGIRDLLNKNINLVSGPGCPVCVTPSNYLDYVYDLSLEKDVIIATYGDMIRVPGSSPARTLEKARALGAAVKMVYSSIDAVELAAENRNKKVVFLGIGFETTTPATVVAIKEAERQKLDNFYVLSLHKLVEPVMKVLLEDKELNIQGFLLPGHVSVILGEEGFKFLNNYECSGIIAGFEMKEIVDALYEIVKSIESNEYTVKNCYKSVVRKQGNAVAKDMFKEVFEVRDDYWRGLGLIKESSLKLNETYKKYDIEKIYPLKYKEEKSSGCRCGDVLKGLIKPCECGNFGKVCVPENPLGPCMVSSEGSCSAYYKYDRNNIKL